MLSKPPPDREDNMTEIILKRTPLGLKTELERTVNDLMEAYECANGLEISSISFERKTSISTRQQRKKLPAVSFSVQVPEC